MKINQLPKPTFRFLFFYSLQGKPKACVIDRGKLEQPYLGKSASPIYFNSAKTKHCESWKHKQLLNSRENPNLFRIRSCVFVRLRQTLMTETCPLMTLWNCCTTMTVQLSFHSSTRWTCLLKYSLINRLLFFLMLTTLGRVRDLGMPQPRLSRFLDVLFQICTFTDYNGRGCGEEDSRMYDLDFFLIMHPCMYLFLVCMYLWGASTGTVTVNCKENSFTFRKM